MVLRQALLNRDVTEYLFDEWVRMHVISALFDIWVVHVLLLAMRLVDQHCLQSIHFDVVLVEDFALNSHFVVVAERVEVDEAGAGAGVAQVNLNIR